MVLVCVELAGAANNQSKLLSTSYLAHSTWCRIVERYHLNQTTPCSISKTFISTTLRQCYESKVTLALRPKGLHAANAYLLTESLHKGIQQM